MMNGKKVFRWALSGCLLAVLVAAGVGVYQLNTVDTVEEQSQEIALEEDLSADASEMVSEEEPSENAGSESVEGTKEVEMTQESAEAETESTETQEESAPAEETTSTEVAETQEEVATEPVINFTEDSLMEWPVTGDVILDYSMDKTIYYPTLDLYKYNPAIVVAAEVNTPVLAAANGQVLSIGANEETGVTMTLDMGNGYQAVYGQLKEVAFEEGDMVEEGAIIGYVSEPTKYYCIEGSNLYFAMTKDGETLDPLMYLP